MRCIPRFSGIRSPAEFGLLPTSSKKTPGRHDGKAPAMEHRKENRCAKHSMSDDLDRSEPQASTPAAARPQVARRMRAPGTDREKSKSKANADPATVEWKAVSG